jgi:hypothetical protein
MMPRLGRGRAACFVSGGRVLEVFNNAAQVSVKGVEQVEELGGGELLLTHGACDGGEADAADVVWASACACTCACACARDAVALLDVDVLAKDVELAGAQTRDVGHDVGGPARARARARRGELGLGARELGLDCGAVVL